jgi:hypothetical protein
MRHRTHKLHRRYGHAARFLHWESTPGGATFAITRDGRQVYTVLLDAHKRKWTLTGTGGFLGSAIRKTDAKKIAQQLENARAA